MISVHLFDDPFLQEIFDKHARLAECEITGREELCIDERHLQPHFDNLVRLYEPYSPHAAEALFAGGSRHDDGTMIWDAIESDFGIFNAMNDFEDNQAILEILYGDDAVLCQNPVMKYTDSFAFDDEMESEHQAWETFKNEIRHENRFFPEMSLDLEKLREIFGFRSKTIPRGSIFFRARGSDLPLGPQKMGAPPKECATAGRANPKGIPYLYLGKNAAICRKEIKIDTSYSLGRFELTEEIRVVDLSNHYVVSPFYFGDKLPSYVANVEILKMYINEMSKPAEPSDPYLDYLPTQYICERMKKEGYDGVLFRSSFATTDEDINLTLFQTTKARCLDVEFMKP